MHAGKRVRQQDGVSLGTRVLSDGDGYNCVRGFLLIGFGGICFCGSALLLLTLFALECTLLSFLNSFLGTTGLTVGRGRDTV